MMGGVHRAKASQGRPGEREPYLRLIELQKQIIELSERNAAAERECNILRSQLAREKEELFRTTQSLAFRVRRSAARLLKRFRSEVRSESSSMQRPNLKLIHYRSEHAQNH
jgi:hypothetical protein